MGNIKSVKCLAQYAAEKYSDKIFCRYYIGNDLVEKSFSEFYQNALAVSRYIRHVSPKRMHIAFIGKTGYEYIACLTGMIFSGNVVVPFAPDISVSEAVKLFYDADIEMLFCEDDFMEKAEAIKGMVEGPLTNLCPASVLRNHPNCVTFLDKAAASLLK